MGFKTWSGDIIVCNFGGADQKFFLHNHKNLITTQHYFTNTKFVSDSEAEPLSTEVLTEAELLACLDMPQSNRVIDHSKVIDA